MTEGKHVRLQPKIIKWLRIFKVNNDMTTYSKAIIFLIRNYQQNKKIAKLKAESMLKTKPKASDFDTNSGEKW